MAERDRARKLARWASEYVAVSGKGFCMGAADVVPGVSGGTMAFILGIYERLLAAIAAFDLAALRRLRRGELRPLVRELDLPFLIALGAGIAAALFVFTRVIPLPSLIRTDPVPVYSLFFGLVAASIVVLLLQLDRFPARDVFWLALGTLAGWGLVNVVPTETPETAWFVFLAGAAATCALVLPGISGSFVLLVLKKYAYVFDAVGRLDLQILIPFGLGAVFGLAMFSRVLLALMRRFRHITLVCIIGLLIGSLWTIWPFQERIYETVRGKPRLVGSWPIAPWNVDTGLLPATSWMVVGLGAVLMLSWLVRRRVEARA